MELAKEKQKKLKNSNLKYIKGFYYPDKEDTLFQKEIDIKIIYQNQKEETLKYKLIPGSFYWDVDDYLSIQKKKKIISNRKQKQSIIVGIPTYKSESYIYNTLMGDKKHRDVFNQLKSIKNKHPDWDVELIINVTPYSHKDKTIEIIKKIQKEVKNSFPSIEVTIFIMPIRGKVNAMNAIAEYAKHKNATILCFLDDDTLHSPNDALLRNIEILLSKNEISIVTSKYTPPKPKCLWEKMRTIRFRIFAQKSVTGRSMIMYAESYHKIPSFLNSDDLYITAYFMSSNSKNPFRRIIVNKDSLAISKIAGNNFLFGLKVLRRSVLGIMQLLSVMPEKKKYIMTRLIEGGSLYSKLKTIKNRSDNLDAILYIIWSFIIISITAIVQIEMFIRRLTRIPRTSIEYFRDESTFSIFE